MSQLEIYIEIIFIRCKPKEKQNFIIYWVLQLQSRLKVYKVIHIKINTYQRFFVFGDLVCPDSINYLIRIQRCCRILMVWFDTLSELNYFILAKLQFNYKTNLRRKTNTTMFMYNRFSKLFCITAFTDSQSQLFWLQQRWCRAFTPTNTEQK